MCNGPATTMRQAQALASPADVQGTDMAVVHSVCGYKWVEHPTAAPTTAKEKLRQAQEERRKRVALQKLAAVRSFADADKEPCMVVEGLYIGGIGAARNIASLRLAGVRHVLNASPVVPRFHPDELTYRVVPVFDDASEDIAQHFAASNAFIAAARAGGGAVLVHCYAGQSRSVALVLAYLLAEERMSFAAAWAAVKAARPAARPNPGFMRQLAEYAQRLGARLDLPMDLEL